MMSFPTISDSKNATLKAWIDFVSRARIADLTFFNGLPNTYVGGRKVLKVPASSSDITDPDGKIDSFVGDMNVTTGFAYFCVNNAGTAEWVRIAVGTF